MMKPAKLHKKKAPKKGREKETKGKDQSPGKQTAQKRQGQKKAKETTKYWNQTYIIENIIVCKVRHCPSKGQNLSEKACYHVKHRWRFLTMHNVYFENNTRRFNPLSQLWEWVTLREPKQKFMGLSPLQM